MKQLITMVVISFSISLASAQPYPFQNSNIPIEERVDNVVSLLSIEEKLKLLRQNEPAISRLGLGTFTYWTEGLHGVAWGQSGTLTATQFPQAYGLGETWDTELMQKIGKQVALEMRAIYNKGKCGLMLRAPVCDLIRDPRWGRTEEAYSEDPFHAGKMAVALIKGLRGDHPTYFMAGSLLKHFVGYGNEINRTESSSDFDQRLLHEYYAKPFERACVDGGALGYMTAYNAVNGVHCIFNEKLKKITREIWGWDGAVCSDNYDLVTSTGYASMAEKAAVAVKNATIGSFDDPKLGNAPEDAFARGLMDINDIDIVIRNTMRVRARLGDLDPPSENAFRSISGSPWESDSAKALAKLVTQKSIVLLKNENNILPLDRESIKSIAIIGSMADSVVRDWYGGFAPYKISSRKGIAAKVGSSVTLRYAQDNMNNAAVSAAQASDIAIVFVGNHPTCAAGWGVCNSENEGKEGFDRTKISLIDDQEDLIRQVFSANANTIVVLMSNFPYAITWANDTIPGIIHMTHCSQETGSALADVLFGDYNPAGRLNVTWPRSVSDLPDIMDYDIRNGRTYMYFKKTPLYEFGYGLSYTSFSYDNLTTNESNFCKDTLGVNVDITNTGKRAGEEVVQLYVKYPESKISRPEKQLCGFKRTPSIPAGGTVTVTIPVERRDLAFWDSTQSVWVVEPGTVKILAGGSSSDENLKVSTSVSVCENVGTSIRKQSKSNLSNGSVVNAHHVFITHKDAQSGIIMDLARNDTYDFSVFDLKGLLVGHLKGIYTSHRPQFIPICKQRVGAGLYIVAGKINGTGFFRTCLVQ